MNRRLLELIGVAAAILVGAVLLKLSPVPLAGQASIPIQTPWGDPDLQGIWTGSTLTPLERRRNFAEKEFLTEEEATGLEQETINRNERLNNRPAERTTANTTTGIEDPVGKRPDGTPGYYNNLWLDNSTRILSDRRTALIVEPPDGRIPYTYEMRARDQLQRTYRVHGARNSWRDVDTGERCITDGVPMFWLGYNANHQIVQTVDHVVILHEMFRDRRIIPLATRPHGAIRQWNGDIRGRWDGDTLVVESQYFVDKTDDRWSRAWRMPTETMHLVERFTRVSGDTLMYEFTVTDPAKFTRPWSVRLPLTTDQAARGVAQGPLYEFACHEGNYSIVNILRGARTEELAVRD